MSNKKEKIIKFFIEFFFWFGIVIGASAVVFRICSLNFLKMEYPNDTLNQAYFTMKIFRSISLWSLTFLPLASMLKRNLSKNMPRLTIFQIALQVIFIVLIIILHNKRLFIPFYITFSIQAFFAVIIIVYNLLIVKRQKFNY